LVYWLYPGFAEKRTSSSLKRAWIGFRIAQREGHLEKMDYCVEGTQKFEKQLGFTVSSFSDNFKAVFFNTSNTTSGGKLAFLDNMEALVITQANVVVATGHGQQRCASGNNRKRNQTVSS
jgi:hypothetical protein